MGGLLFSFFASLGECLSEKIHFSIVDGIWLSLHKRWCFESQRLFRFPSHQKLRCSNWSLSKKEHGTKDYLSMEFQKANISTLLNWCFCFVFSISKKELGVALTYHSVETTVLFSSTSHFHSESLAAISLIEVKEEEQKKKKERNIHLHVPSPLQIVCSVVIQH